MPNRHRSAGFTMLEVMISIVIIAFGLLGIAGLQAFALKNTASANQRLIATMLAEDFIDRLRANQPAMVTNEYHRPLIAAYRGGPDCHAARCGSTADVAAFDRTQWSLRVGAALPGGAGIVCIDSTPNDGTSTADPQCDGLGEVMYAVKIWWNDDRNATNPQLHKFVTAFHP